ncbi:MAG: CocE/NonD family hydrolase [Lewinellaceae bacterium]|nr:CocE/NonD family hydrolase [Lewinellaceae bacterium]
MNRTVPNNSRTGRQPLLYLAFFFGLTTALQAQLTPTYIVDIPMRDGKTLAADVYVPDACTGCPTILIQTPYNKNTFRNGLPLGFGQNLQSSPYSWVVVDWRGFYGSAAAATAQANRGQDGYDVLEWIKVQAWANGKVGTWGPSALGSIQYQTAKEKHPNHTCAVPLVAHPQQSYDSYFYGGVLEKSRLQSLDLLGYGLSPLILANPYYNLIWQIAENSSWYPQDIQIPTLQIGGWYDHNIDKMMDWYTATRNEAALAVRDKQWLLVGPWVHGGTGLAFVGSPNQGQLIYADAAFVNNQMALDFFNFYLLGTANGWENTPKITYYELGKNSWNTSNAASIEIANTDTLFLNGNAAISTQPGGGSTSFSCDPKNPSPTIGGHTLSLGLQQGPFDQTSLESRADVLPFSTAVLPADIAVSGRVRAQLYVQADQPDADIAIRLVDGYPDGRNMLINDGIHRMRFRNGYTQAAEAFMSPGQVYMVEVELPFINYTWKAGHTLNVYVSGNSSTRWDVNLQNGGTMYAPGDTNIAQIQVHHSAQYPSKLLLPGNNQLSATRDLLPATAVSLFPNPASGFVTVESTLPLDRYEIFDLTGKRIHAGKLPGGRINVSGLQNGVYLVQFFSAGRTVMKKLVKH